MSYINAYTVDTHRAFMGMPFVRLCVYRAFMRMYMIQLLCRSMSSFRAYVCPAFIRMSCVHACVMSLCVCMYVVLSCIMYVCMSCIHN